MLKKIFNSLLPPKEIKAVQYELKVLFEHNYFSCASLMLDDALRICTIDQKEILHGIQKEKRVPYEVALTIVNNMSAHMVTSGKFHVFFGVLDHAQGADLYAVFHHSLKLLETYGFLNDQQVEETKKNVEMGIATIG